MVVRGEHHAGTGVGVAGDPGAVDSKHHQQHQHEHGDDGLDVWTQTLLGLLLLRHVLSHLAGLQGETNTIVTERRVCSCSEGRLLFIKCNKWLNGLIVEMYLRASSAWQVNIILYVGGRELLRLWKLWWGGTVWSFLFASTSNYSRQHLNCG